MQNKKDSLFILELILAIIITIICSLIGMSNLLWESNQLYPAATDAMGHMTKVVYLSDQILKGNFPSWFSYWYNGSATIQYYVPLSYYLMIPIYWVTSNIMLTFKIFSAAALAIGGFGVWTFCYRKIGRGCGLIGIIAFCLQPMLLQSSYREGVIAQGPIFAIMPWLLLLILSLMKKPSKAKYIGTTLLTTLMILSHAMHAFMVCLTIVIVLLLLILFKKARIRDFMIATSCIALSGIITAFWSLVGATQLENPGIPYLLPEAVAFTTADIQWFIPDSQSFFYFSIEVLALSFIGFICYIISRWRKINKEDHDYYGLACIALTIITVVFSFGMRLPGFKYLPFASSMVAGRILTFTAVSAAITSAYTIYMLWNSPRVKPLLRLITLAVIIYVGYTLNPYERTYSIVDADEFNTMKELVSNKADAFDKGRYQWIDNQISAETYYAYLYDYNICKGWNIEGTLHNQKLYNDNIALPLEKNEYILKEIAYWNIRYLLVPDKYQDLVEQLENKMGFRASEANRNGNTLYVSDMPSAYYLTDSRNAIVISTGMQGFSAQFPHFVQGKSSDILDYTDEELLKYKLIYIIEPEINTLTKKNDFEAMVTRLVNNGATILIEPMVTNGFDIFGVRVEDANVNDTIHIKTTAENTYNFSNTMIKDNSNLYRIRSIYNLDEIYANYEVSNNNVSNAIIGAKNVGEAGKVIFVGAHLSQYLDVVYTRNNGLAAYSDLIKDNSERVEALYSDIFSYYGANTNYLPSIFDTVIEHKWDYNGGTFIYESEEAQEVTISVTYTPRWSATLDGKELSVGQSENLITLMLPEGRHTVELYYGMTIYGKIGYIISAIGIFLFIIGILLWDMLIRLSDRIAVAVGNYLQIYHDVDDIGQESKRISDAIEEVSIKAQSVEAITEESITDNIIAEENLTDGVITDEISSEAAITDEITEENEMKTEDDLDALSIQYRVVNERDIKVDIIMIDGKPSTDSMIKTYDKEDHPEDIEILEETEGIKEEIDELIEETERTKEETEENIREKYEIKEEIEGKKKETEEIQEDIEEIKREIDEIKKEIKKEIDEIIEKTQVKRERYIMKPRKK